MPEFLLGYTMQSATTNTCAATNPHCNGVCSGYGTQTVCPPLIVLAVLSTQRPEPAATTH
jgi:hypothetical protein